MEKAEAVNRLRTLKNYVAFEGDKEALQMAIDSLSPKEPEKPLSVCCNLSSGCCKCCFNGCDQIETCKFKCDKEFEGKSASCQHLLLTRNRRED